jgi:hypothetical protein
VQVAMLIPFTENEEGINPATNAIRAIKNLRKGITFGKELSIKKMIEEGRK